MARRRIHGPYKHGNRWRVILVGEDGTQVVESFGSQDEAEAEKRRNEEEIEDYEGITVAKAIDEYEIHQRSKGNKPRSIETTRGRLERLLSDVLARPLCAIKEATAFRLYAKLRTSGVSVDFHWNALNETRSFFKWCAEAPNRWIKSNPFAAVKGIGKRKKGKPQLHADEAARFLDKAHELADQGQMAGFVAAGAFYFGTRITELVSRPVRDLDLDGWWLWISDSKTESGRRKLDVPAEFRPYLLKLAEGKGAHESLFIGERKGKTVTRYTAYDMVKRVCRLAGVPVVTPHGLRGTHASIAREAGATPNIVAAAIGHRSYAVTQRHYLAAGSEERAQQQTVMKVIRGGKRGN